MKYEWRKEEKNLFLPKTNPVLIEVPNTKYICIKGKGNPNNEDFSNRIGALYSMAYAIRMMPKGGYTPEGYFEYTVFPLEGLWDLTDNGKKQFSKDELIYTIMIKQPDFVNIDVFNIALEIAKKKKPNILLDEVYFDEIEDGLSVQIMHIGSFDSEPLSFAKMKDFIKENNLEIKSLVHREIYLSDTRKVEKDKLKTVLRYSVTK